MAPKPEKLIDAPTPPGSYVNAPTQAAEAAEFSDKANASSSAAEEVAGPSGNSANHPTSGRPYDMSWEDVPRPTRIAPNGRSMHQVQAAAQAA
ncbi:MAG: hypothetical protein Q9183_006175, partial [Haloplaca sp. 2 TL-2023]